MRLRVNSLVILIERAAIAEFSYERSDFTLPASSMSICQFVNFGRISSNLIVKTYLCLVLFVCTDFIFTF